jgi:hypothetical protein
MSRINNFKRFSKVYENEAQSSSEEVIELAKEQMPLEEVADDALQLSHPDKSNIQDRMVAAAQEVAQSEPEPEQVPEQLKESYTGEDLLNPATMDIIMNGTLARIPLLQSGSIVKYRGQRVSIPEAAQFKATKFVGWSEGYSLTYKDVTGKYPDVYVDYSATQEELDHIFAIFDDLAKKSKWMNFIDRTGSIVGMTSILVGFGLIIFGALRFQANVTGQDAWLAGGGGGYGPGGFSWDKVAPIGGYEAAAGGGLAVFGTALMTYVNFSNSEELKKFNSSVKKLISVLKAFLEPLNMKITDIKTASDLQAVLNSDMAKVEVEVEVAPNTPTNLREGKTTKYGKLRRF